MRMLLFRFIHEQREKQRQGVFLFPRIITLRELSGLFPILSILLLSTAAAGDERDRIATLIERLGDDEYQERQEATEELVNLGLPALPALEEARKSEDAEVRHRAERARKRILTDNHIFDGLKVALRSDKNEYPEGATIALTLEITNISGHDKEITLYDDEVVRYSDTGARYESQSSCSRGIVRIEQIASSRDLRKLQEKQKQLARMGQRTVTIKNDNTIAKPYVIKTLYDGCFIETQESEEEESDKEQDLVQPLEPGTYEIIIYLSRNEKPLGIGTVREFPVSPNRPVKKENNIIGCGPEKIQISPGEYTTEDEELRSNTITIKILPGDPREKKAEAEE